MGKMGKKLFNLAAIITSLYRVITVMTLRHCYVIMSHIQLGCHILCHFFVPKSHFPTEKSLKKSDF